MKSDPCHARSASSVGAAERSSVLRACHWVAASSVCEELHLAAGQPCHRQSVAEQQPVAGKRREFRARSQDAREVQRVGAGQRDEFAGMRPAPHLAQHADSIGQARIVHRRSRRRSGRRGFRRAPPGGDRRAADRATAAATQPRAPADARTPRRSGAAARAPRVRSLQPWPAAPRCRESAGASMPSGRRPPCRSS